GDSVLKGRGETETARVGPGKPLTRAPGLYRLAIHYRSLPDRPARLQIWWQGATFAREPLPAWLLKHRAEDLPHAVAHEQPVDKGRAAVGKLGCARCHNGAFPGVAEPPPGPSLADVRRRISRAWLLDWLADPAKVRKDARMPALFSSDRTGFVERWIIAQHLLGAASSPAPPEKQSNSERDGGGDHRLGRRAFISLGRGTCHLLPHIPLAHQPNADRSSLTGLGDRLPADELAAFLANPHARYPDGRMPRLPLTPDMARNIAAYLLLWSKTGGAEGKLPEPPTAAEIRQVTRRLGGQDLDAATATLIRQKGCAVCHPGLGPSAPTDVPLTVTEDSRG